MIIIITVFKEVKENGKRYSLKYFKRSSHFIFKKF